MRRLLRRIGVLLGYGFRAAPGAMWLTLGLVIVNGVSAGLYPLGFRLFTDAFLARDAGDLTIAVVLTAGLIALNWTSANLDANVGFGLTDRIQLFVSAHLASLVNRAERIEHFERPDYLAELELVEQNTGMVASGPRQTLTAIHTVLRAAGVVLLFGSVHPVLLALPLLGVLPTWAEARSVRIRQRAEEEMAEQKRLGDQLFSIATTAAPAKEVRTYGLADELIGRHEAIGRDVSAKTTRAAVQGAALAAVAWVVFIIGFLAGIAVVLRAATRREVTPGEVVLAVVLAQQVRVVLGLVATSVGQVMTTVRTVDRLLWLEDVVDLAHHGSMPPPSALRDGIVFDNVSFRYPGTERDVLTDVDLRLPAGATIALVGDNGAGKTTLVKLLTGMYEPTTGTIGIDGTPLRDIDLAAWRARTSAAFQDHVAWELIAAETVGIGDLDHLADREVITAALERAAAGDVVTSLGEGLDTQLGRSFPGGRELSGGQWQKLALGRGMMREEPLLLVLDEPTASLDASTEHQLFERYALAAKRTAARTGCVTVLVSHRFSTVRNADLIVVIDGGRVVEAGSHAELMQRGGLYAELFELQARAYR